MNKSQLIQHVIQSTNLSKDQAETAVAIILDSIFEALQGRESVGILNFGTFKASSRPARVGRNPKTGKPIKIEAKFIVKFIASSNLVENINDDSDHTGPRNPRLI